VGVVNYVFRLHCQYVIADSTESYYSSCSDATPIGSVGKTSTELHDFAGSITDCCGVEPCHIHTHSLLALLLKHCHCLVYYILRMRQSLTNMSTIITFLGIPRVGSEPGSRPLVETGYWNQSHCLNSGNLEVPKVGLW
jgi:hypothetical protein